MILNPLFTEMIHICDQKVQKVSIFITSSFHKGEKHENVMKTVNSSENDKSSYYSLQTELLLYFAITGVNFFSEMILSF